MFSLKTHTEWFKPKVRYWSLAPERLQLPELSEALEEEDKPAEVLQPEESYPNPLAPRPVSKSLRSAMIAFTLSLIPLGLLFTVASVYFMQQSRSHQLPTYPHLHSSSELQSRLLGSGRWNYSNPSPCGHSVESARAAGCQFSPMVWAWYPPACYDFELEEEFLGLTGWEYYATKELRQQDRLPRDEVERGDHPKIYSNLKYHRYHCTYSFKKLLRSFLGVALSDNYVLTMSHMGHCEGFLVQNEIPPYVKGVAKYLDCVVP